MAVLVLVYVLSGLWHMLSALPGGGLFVPSLVRVVKKLPLEWKLASLKTLGNCAIVQ